MSVCIKCSADNPATQKYCQKCGAVLPQMAPMGLPATSSLDVDENTQYLSPQAHYPADELLNLAWTANDFLEEGADLDPFLDAYEIVKKKFGVEMHDHLKSIMEIIADDRARFPDEPFPKQVSYLYNKGAGLADEGLASVEAFLSGLDENRVLPERLRDGVVKLVMANDHFCYAIGLTQVRLESIEQANANLGISRNADGEFVAGPIPRTQKPVGAPVGVAADAEDDEDEDE